MARVCVHELDKEGKYCKFCGSNPIQIANNLPCIWRDTQDLRFGGVRPEPKEKTYAYMDVDVIYDRIQELKQEDDAMVNHVDEG